MSHTHLLLKVFTKRAEHDDNLYMKIEVDAPSLERELDLMCDEFVLASKTLVKTLSKELVSKTRKHLQGEDWYITCFVIDNANNTVMSEERLLARGGKTVVKRGKKAYEFDEVEDLLPWFQETYPTILSTATQGGTDADN